MTRLSKYTAALAVLAVVSATSAGAAALITGKDVRNHSLTGADLELRTLAVKHLTTVARAKLTPPPSAGLTFHLKVGQPIIGGASRSVGRLELPTGSWILSAKAVVANTGGASASPDCELGTLDGSTFRQIDQVDGVAIAPATAQPIVMLGAVAAGTPTTVELRCIPGAGQTLIARDRVITATSVAGLTE